MRIAKRMHGPAQVSSSAADKYTVGSNRRGIIRHVHVQNPTGSTVTFTMSIGADAAATRLFDGFGIGANQVIDHWCYYVLEETEKIQALAGTNNILVLTIDGDEDVLA